MSNVISLQDRKKNRLLEALDTTKGGIPATGETKNRNSLLIINRDDYDLDRITRQMSDMLTDLLENTIDTFTVDVKTREQNS
jgi:hypothetical protein